MSSPQFPEPPEAVAPTAIADVDKAIARVASRKDDWLKVDLPTRIGYLRRGLLGVLSVAERWVRDGCRLKGIAEGDPLVGEEWLAGPWTTVRNLRMLILALEANGQPTPPALYERDDGQKVARVYPMDLKDKLMFSGFSAEVWIEPGKPASQGRIYREAPRPPGKVHAKRASMPPGAGSR